jgi:hypothetical protein
VRIELVEKMIFALAVVAIMMVAGLVGFFSFLIQKDSGISLEECQATDNCDKWLSDARTLASGQQVSTSGVLLAAGPMNTGAGGAGGAAKAAPKVAPGQVDTYIVKDGESIPQQEQVPGVPWLRKQEGVTYMKPEAVPQIYYEKYQAFDDAWSEAQRGSGEFVDGRYKINYVDPSSLLGTKVGLREGDEIESVNGQPIGASFNASRGLYDSLKGEKHFAVKVRRGGQDVILSFYVN